MNRYSPEKYWPMDFQTFSLILEVLWVKKIVLILNYLSLSYLGYSPYRGKDP